MRDNISKTPQKEEGEAMLLSKMHIFMFPLSRC